MAQKYLAHTHHIGLEEGLSSYNIEAFYQDDKGFMWICTDYGLNKYDGAEMKYYTKEENGLLSNHILQVISEDENGYLQLLGKTEDQRFCHFFFDPIEEKSYTFEAYTGLSFPSPPATTFSYKALNGVSTYIHIDNSDKPHFYTFDGQRFSTVLEDYPYKEYIHHKPSLFYRLKNGDFALQLEIGASGISTTVTTNARGHSSNLSSSLPDFNDNILLQIWRGKAYKVHVSRNNNLQQLTYESLENNGSVSGTFTVKDHYQEYSCRNEEKVFVLGDGYVKVLNTHSPSTSSSIPVDIHLDHTYPYIFIDKDENIWVKTKDGFDIVSIQPSVFSYALTDWDQPKKIRGIGAEVDNIFAVGIGFSLRKNPSTHHWEEFTNGAFNYLGLLNEPHGIWMGTEIGTVNYYDKKTEQYYRFPVDRPSKDYFFTHVWQPYRAPNGDVWIGTSQGIYRLNTTQKKFVPLINYNGSPLEGSTVYHFYSNTAGTWLCTSTGLYLVDLKNERIIERFGSTGKKDNFIPSNNIAHLVEDNNGVFWLATKGDGLIRWNPKTKKYKQYTKKSAGLPHNVLYSVYMDDFNNLWTSGQRGLMRFNMETEFVQTYYTEDGLPHNEFNTISHYKDKNGRLYFGGQNGMIHFHPKKILDDTHAYPLVITRCDKLNSEEQHLNLTSDFMSDPTITIATTDKSIKLSFALLNYMNSENHQYSYKLVGYDKEWTFLETNEVELRNLPYGTYTLKIRAKSASMGNWVEYPDDITIVVPAPFYLKWWFWLFCLAVFFLLIFLLTQSRLRRLQKRKRELEKTVEERTIQIILDKEVIEKQAKELKALDELKSRFFANLSHELRTPLTLILGPLSYILDNSDAWEEKEVKEQLTTIERNGRKLMELIEEILDLSKLEENKMFLEEDFIQVHDFFAQIFEQFSPYFQSQNINAELKTNFDKNAYLFFDRKKIEKVVYNFLSNAVKFTPSGEKIILSSHYKDDLFEISVSDNGEGIHPDDLPYIFDRYYQSKRTDQKLQGGTGIGLALVSEFAELMSGTVEVESELGKGSTFTLRIPTKRHRGIDSKPSSENESLDQKETSGGNLENHFTVLVVEDNKDMCNFISQVLQKKYKSVLTARDGLEGLEIIKEHGNGIHLIVSDVMMPNMDGLELLKEIKSHEEWHKIPVIMLTALSTKKDKLNALTIGVDDYLTKPFSVPELLARSQNLLSNYQQRIKWQSKEPLKKEIEDTPSALLKINAIEVNKTWIEKMKSQVLLKIEEGIPSVEELASDNFLSSRQLTRKIKQLTGLTPAKFMREIQLQEALRILEEGSVISVSEVAYQLGFEQLSSFSRLFKQRFGKAPSEYTGNKEK